VTGGSRILVGDAEQRSVLATCRGLAAAGYRVSTVGAERFALAHWLRFSKERVMLAGLEVDSERDSARYVERLSRVLRRGAYDLLMPGRERLLLPTSERRELVESYVHLGLPPHDVVLRALDKPLFYDQAAVAGLPRQRASPA
jgi:hypothetical protein